MTGRSHRVLAHCIQCCRQDVGKEQKLEVEEKKKLKQTDDPKVVWFVMKPAEEDQSSYQAESNSPW